MNIWKIILATLVIYSAGLFTGVLLVRHATPVAPVVQANPGVTNRPPMPGPDWAQRFFIERMRRELELTPEQTRRVEQIFADSRDRTTILFDLIKPDMKAEFELVRKQVEAELTPDQRTKYAELLRRPPHRSGGGFGPPGKPRRPRDSGDPGSHGPSGLQPGPPPTNVPPF